MEVKRVSYVYSADYLDSLSRCFSNIDDRAVLVHSLIVASGLLDYMDVVKPTPASFDDLAGFHDREYLSFLKDISESGEVGADQLEDAAEFGLAYDCPVFEGMYEFGAAAAGATLAAARLLASRRAHVAINWGGGWHHAKRYCASGYCYINDIALGIQELCKTFHRVLYVDLDLHHGDGVEEAFWITPRVFTLSFHHHGPGFYPGSGAISDIGQDIGRHHCANVPLKEGLSDANFVETFRRLVPEVVDVYRPDAIVCQLGADGLTGDPMDVFNLTPAAFVHAARVLASCSLPMLVLGGGRTCGLVPGGYNVTNVARCWTQVTAALVGARLPADIPDHHRWDRYGPDFQLTVPPGNRIDRNTDQYLQSVITKVLENLRSVKTSRNYGNFSDQHQQDV